MHKKDNTHHQASVAGAGYLKVCPIAAKYASQDNVNKSNPGIRLPF